MPSQKCRFNSSADMRQAEDPQALVSYIYLFTIYVYPWIDVDSKQIYI